MEPSELDVGLGRLDIEADAPPLAVLRDDDKVSAE